MPELTYRKLRGRIIEKFGTLAAFADALELSRVAVSNKLNGRSYFNQADMVKWGDLLEISADEIADYFFS